MRLLDFTLPTPEENLAMDEALLDACEASEAPEMLRIWSPASHFVVAGYANSLSRETDLAACQTLGIPVFRRCSGGGTVLQGPGCLNYALILRIDSHPALAAIHSANEWIMNRQRRALQSLLDDEQVEVRGHTDLAVNGLKCSGNAQRRKRHALLFHGSFLTGMDLELIARALRFPSKEPSYRAGRRHQEFLRNIDTPALALEKTLAREWSASGPLEEAPWGRLKNLLQSRYSLREWHERFP